MKYSYQRIVQMQSQKRNLRAVLRTNRDLAANFSTIQEINEFLRQVLVEKDTYANKYCDSIETTRYEVQQGIVTEQFTLIIEKVPASSIVFNRSYVQKEASYLSIPLNTLVEKEKQLN
jgi:hypothetical protein